VIVSRGSIVFFRSPKLKMDFRSIMMSFVPFDFFTILSWSSKLRLKITVYEIRRGSMLRVAEIFGIKYCLSNLD